MKPCEQIRGEVGARDHDLVARLKIESGSRNADTLRGAVRQRDLPGVGSYQPRQPGAHALRQIEVVALPKPIRMALQIAGLMNARHCRARERALVSTVQVDDRGKVRKVPPVILRRPVSIETRHAFILLSHGKRPRRFLTFCTCITQRKASLTAFPSRKALRTSGSRSTRFVP